MLDKDVDYSQGTKILKTEKNSCSFFSANIEQYNNLAKQSKMTIKAFLQSEKDLTVKEKCYRPQIMIEPQKDYEFYKDRRKNKLLWIIEIATNLKLEQRTIHLGIYYSDYIIWKRYLSEQEIDIISLCG